MMSDFQFNESGTKYLRTAHCAIEGQIDVYAVLDAFDVRCPARQHAIKKLLCAGIRGKNNELDDLREAEDAIKRAIQMHQAKVYGIAPYITPPAAQTSD
jgi:hypothetical protein